MKIAASLLSKLFVNIKRKHLNLPQNTLSFRYVHHKLVLYLKRMLLLLVFIHHYASFKQLKT